MGFIKYLIVFVAMATTTAHAGEHRKRIVMIDTGMSKGAEPYWCNNGHFDATGTTIYAIDDHGPAMAQTIAENMNVETHCISSVKWFHDRAHFDATVNSTTKLDKAIKKYLDFVINRLNNVDVINLSMESTEFSETEKAGLATLLARGHTVVVSSGNRGIDFDKACTIFPACYGYKSERFFVVGMNASYSDKGGPVNVIEDGRLAYNGLIYKGTSISAARWSGIVSTKSETSRGF